MRFLKELVLRISLRLVNRFQRAQQRYEISNVRKTPGLVIAESVKIIGLPIIDISNGGKIVIGESVTLNSKNRKYHLNMHSPVKLMVDQPGAFIRIGDRTRIHGACLHAYSSISVGRNCLIAANVQIIDCSGHDSSFLDVENRINTNGISRPIYIEDNVWIGANTIILPGVTIGQGSIVAAGSVVSKNIPPMGVAGGVPARVIKEAQEYE